ncbi:zinc-dependent alcohol dehydrogenase [Rugosimonospora africana]|uniref:Oxidoreductase n=1 Tax=Rugosimonospora africana TaxID=556532 RepID=A0A8J3QUG4_9ACTN|nr:alcohol dehydrogenase catalytic domain-containing protein [Rugosimonospora africana]GIH15938.1 oxidoreductase [Rugosimonospora africana]
MRFSQVIGPRSSVVLDAPDPSPSAGQVLVDVLACGVCTSDRRAWREQATAERPIRLGHEIVGRIVEVGSDASGWRVGDTVTGLGGEGFATRALLDARSILPVPAGIPPELAIGEPLAVLVEALGRTGIRPGDRVAIVGLGFMGLALVQLTRQLLPATIIGIDPDPHARERGERAGCAETFAPDDIPAHYREAGPASEDRRMDAVLEAAGVDSALRVSATLVKPHGVVNVIGYHSSGTAQLDLDLWYKGVTIVNGFSPQRPRVMAAMAEGLDRIARRQFSFAPLVTDRLGLDQVDEAFALMERREPAFVKSVIVP